MRPRSALVGRNARRARVKERRVGDDAVRRLVDESCRAPGMSIADVDLHDTDAGRQRVALRIARGETRKLGIKLDEIGGRGCAAADDRQTDRADAGADIDD